MQIPDSWGRMALVLGALVFLAAPSHPSPPPPGPALPAGDGGLHVSTPFVYTSSPDGSTLYLWRPSSVVLDPSRGGFPASWIVQQVNLADRKLTVVEVK